MTTGGEPAACERRAAEEVPAGVAGQVQVEQHDVRAQAAVERRDRRLGRRRLVDPIAPAAQVARDDPPQALVVLDDQDCARTLQSSADPFDGDVGAGVVGHPQRHEPHAGLARPAPRAGSSSASPKLQARRRRRAARRRRRPSRSPRGRGVSSWSRVRRTDDRRSIGWTDPCPQPAPAPQEGTAVGRACGA